MGDSKYRDQNLQYGLCSITVRACGRDVDSYLQKMARAFPSRVQTPGFQAYCSLVVVSPILDNCSCPEFREISQAWAQTRQSLLDTNRQTQSLHAWRTIHQLGILVEQSSFLFQFRDSDQERYFCLLPADTLRRPSDPVAWIIQALEGLGLHWYTTHGGGPFHASGVESYGHGYLFLGPSDAGKSTIAELTLQTGGKIIHDDQIMIASQSEEYRLSHPDSRDSPRLRAIFILKKSDHHRLVPLTPLEVNAELTMSMLDYAIGQDHYGAWVRQAFHNAAAIARKIPGYVLHFRKSSDFWEVIDTELGNG